MVDVVHVSSVVVEFWFKLLEPWTQEAVLQADQQGSGRDTEPDGSLTVCIKQ